jgi:hypothetical protein
MIDLNNRKRGSGYWTKKEHTSSFGQTCGTSVSSPIEEISVEFDALSPQPKAIRRLLWLLTNAVDRKEPG